MQSPLRHLTETSAHKLGRNDDTIEWPPPAPVVVPLCYVVDEEPTIRHLLSLVLHGSGIDTVEVADGAALREAWLWELHVNVRSRNARSAVQSATSESRRRAA